MMAVFDAKKCLICNNGKKNNVLHWHHSDTDIWCWCCKCGRSYSLEYYCAQAGITIAEFLKSPPQFEEAQPNTVNKLEWPADFIPLFDLQAKEGDTYLRRRHIDPVNGIYFDKKRKGIVFPYYFHDAFCGAQIRYIEPKLDEDGEPMKIGTMTGTRLGLLFYNWNQAQFPNNIKGVIVTEGAFNTLAIQQALMKRYNTVMMPWRCIATSGSNITEHHVETLQELKNAGIKIVGAPDGDEAGLKMLEKMINSGIITHYALPDDEKVDWNDLLIKLGDHEFANFFIKRVTNV